MIIMIIAGLSECSTFFMSVPIKQILVVIWLVIYIRLQETI